MLRAYVRLPTNGAAAADTIREAPRRFQKTLPEALNPEVNHPMLREISAEPAQWKSERRWKSKKQMRFVMAMLRKANNLPYKRTHTLVKQWHIRFHWRGDAGEMLLENLSPIMRYVQGDDQQPMHADSRWPQLAPTVAKYQPIATRVLVATWHAVNGS